MKYYTEEERKKARERYNKRYYLRNREKFIERAKEWSLGHREHLREYQRKYRQEHYIKRKRKDYKAKIEISCKFCAKKIGITKKAIERGRKFCGRGCYNRWAIKYLTVPKEVQRLNKNKYYREYHKKKRWKSPGWQFKRKRKAIKGLLGALKTRIGQVKREKLKERMKFVCKTCGESFYGKTIVKKRVYCSVDCQMDDQQIWGSSLERRREARNRYRGNIPKKQFEKMKADYGYRCAICGRKEPFLDQFWTYLVQDHIFPKSKGGKRRDKKNVQPACWDCNSIKRDKLPEELKTPDIGIS